MRPDERFLVPKMRFIVGTASRVNLAALIVLAVLLGARPAAAQGCDAVVDETGLVDEAEVQRALTELDGQADAKVYVFQSVSNNDIDTAVDDLIARCFSDGPAGRQADLVVIAVSIDDRLTSLEYGISHNVELGEVIDVIDGVDVTRADEIRDDVINTRFAAGDITGGIVNGLAALDESIGPLDGVGDTGSGDTGSAATGGADGSSSSETSSEPDAGFPWGVALVGGGVTVGGVGLLVSRRRKLVAERNTLESESQQPRVAVGVGRERSARLMAQAGVWEQLVLGGTLEELLERVADGRQAASDTERAVALFDQAIPRGIAEAKSGEVAVATARLRELEASLERFNEALDRIEFFGGRIDRLRVTLPRKREQITTEIDQSLRLATEREGAGWKVAQPQQRLANAREQLAALDFDPLQVDLVDLSLVVEASEAELFAARHDLQTLDDTVESLQAWADQLAAGEKMERDRIEETRSALAEIARHHAPESWRWAGDHLDGAFVSLDHAASSRLRSTDVHLPGQDWDEAGKSLEAAGLELIRSDDLLDEVDSLLVSLDTAKEHAAAVLAQAGNQVHSLRSFVGKHDEDLPARFDVEPNDADAALAGLRAELDKELPNYLRVAQTGDRLARQLDALFGEARDEQARVEALRREIERERARAFREIERAEKAIGWELLQSRNGKDLDNLKQELSERSASLEIELRSVQSIADQAVEIRSDAIARRRRASTWIVAGSSGGGFGGGGSSGGGGGFGGGGFGGGGGSGGGGSFGGGGGSSSW